MKPPPRIVPAPPRSRNFRAMFTEDEHRMIHALARAKGLTASDVVRQLVRDAWFRHTRQVSA